MIFEAQEFFPVEANATREADAPSAGGRRPLGDVRELVRRGQAKEDSALSELVRRYHPRVMGLVRQVVRDVETARDVAQIVFVKMIRRLPALRDAAVFEPWLFQMARNAALDELRRLNARPQRSHDQSAWDDVCVPSHDDATWELAEAIQVVTAQWDDRTRRLLEQMVEGRSYRQIATCEGWTIGATKLRVFRLRQDLRRRVRVMLGQELPLLTQRVRS